jgi:hypothetical protein
VVHFTERKRGHTKSPAAGVIFMQSIIRERILEQLLSIPNLVDQFATQESHFMQSVVTWLRATEQALEPFRLPLISRLATIRGQLISVSEGHLEVATIKVSRKQKRGEAIKLLQQSEEALRDHIANIDRQFDEFREKLSQLLAVASSREALPATDHITTGYLDKVWDIAKKVPENSTLALYLQGRLTETDRRYLLADLIEHLLAKVVTAPN